MMVEHHTAQLQGLDVVLVQHQGLLEALHRRLKVPKLSAEGKGMQRGGGCRRWEMYRYILIYTHTHRLYNHINSFKVEPFKQYLYACPRLL